MSPERDMDDMQRRFALDDATADRLLSGTMSPADAPPAYGGVASLLQTAIDAPADKELRREAEVVALAAAAAAAVVARSAVTVRGGKRWKWARTLPVRLAAIGGVGMLGAGTAAAAATGNLPSQTSHATHGAGGLATAAAHLP